VNDTSPEWIENLAVISWLVKTQCSVFDLSR